jgi:signal transduction histidine kinase
LNGGTYRGRFVEIEGTLVSSLQKNGEDQLILRDGDQVFNVIGTRDLRLDAAKVEPGSRLRLRGCPTSLPQYTEGIYPFTVLANSEELLSTPPWWSPRHMEEILLACFFLFALVLWVLHRLRNWQMKSILREREQLAYEIHDTLAQSFAGIAYQLQAASIEQRGEEQIKSRIQDTLKMVDLSHKEASRTIAALRPQYHDAADMVDALREIAERLIDGGKLDIVTHFEGTSWVLPIPVTDALFRIGQEAVMNALQHARCTQLTITLKLTINTAHLTVQDNGIGIPDRSDQGGLGIAGMRNRAARIKADFKLESQTGVGTSMTVVAPIPIAGGFFSRMRSMILASL